MPTSALWPPRLSAFDVDEFLMQLERQTLTHIYTGLPIANKRDKAALVQLYSLFVRSPNFRAWLSVRLRSAQLSMMRDYVAYLRSLNFAAEYLSCRDELQRVDLLIELRQIFGAVSEESAAALLRVFEQQVLHSLPDDLRRSMQMTQA